MYNSICLGYSSLIKCNFNLVKQFTFHPILLMMDFDSCVNWL